jgi:hypothetical protein
MNGVQLTIQRNLLEAGLNAELGNKIMNSVQLLFSIQLNSVQ